MMYYNVWRIEVGIDRTILYLQDSDTLDYKSSFSLDFRVPVMVYIDENGSAVFTTTGNPFEVAVFGNEMVIK